MIMFNDDAWMYFSSMGFRVIEHSIISEIDNDGLILKSNPNLILNGDTVRNGPLGALKARGLIL